MTRCPADCVYPQIHRSRFRWATDLLPLFFLQLPYRCMTCGGRFHRTSRLLAGCAAVVALAFAYPLSYHQLAEHYSSNPTVKSIYQPLLWVEQQMLSDVEDSALPPG